jgi:hypothetical protein
MLHLAVIAAAKGAIWAGHALAPHVTAAGHAMAPHVAATHTELIAMGHKTVHLAAHGTASAVSKAAFKAAPPATRVAMLAEASHLAAQHPAATAGGGLVALTAAGQLAKGVLADRIKTEVMPKLRNRFS